MTKQIALFTYEGLSFSFQHGYADVEMVSGYDNSVLLYADRQVTWCYVYRVDDPVQEVLFEGLAVTHSGEQFVKAIGRKESLKDVLSKMELSKRERREIWELYFSMIHKNWEE